MDEFDRAPIAQDRSSFWESGDSRAERLRQRIVAAFDIDIWAEGGENFGSLGGGDDQAGGLSRLFRFNVLDGTIVVETHNQFMSQGFSGGEVADMASMEQVEATIGKNKGSPLLRLGFNNLLKIGKVINSSHC